MFAPLCASSLLITCLAPCMLSSTESAFPPLTPGSGFPDLKPHQCVRSCVIILNYFHVANVFPQALSSHHVVGTCPPRPLHLEPSIWTWTRLPLGLECSWLFHQTNFLARKLLGSMLASHAIGHRSGVSLVRGISASSRASFLAVQPSEPQRFGVHPCSSPTFERVFPHSFHSILTTFPLLVSTAEATSLFKQSLLLLARAFHSQYQRQLLL